jgi:hypothetical protein
VTSSNITVPPIRTNSVSLWLINDNAAQINGKAIKPHPSARSRCARINSLSAEPASAVANCDWLMPRVLASRHRDQRNIPATKIARIGSRLAMWCVFVVMDRNLGEYWTPDWSKLSTIYAAMSNSRFWPYRGPTPECGDRLGRAFHAKGIRRPRAVLRRRLVSAACIESERPSFITGS